MKKITTQSSLNGLLIAGLFLAGNASAQMGLMVTITQKTDATVCTGSCNGSATASVSGGTAPYTYIWSEGQTTLTATGLCPATYTFYAIDASTPIPAYGNVTVTINCIGAVNDYSMNKYLQVFPNPASDIISVELLIPNSTTITAVSVMNMLGETVWNENYSREHSFTNKIFVGTLPKGIYFIEMRNEEDIYRTKFIKQ